jgi:hypothetical protein
MIKRDADKFFHGFIPIWALTLFSIAIMFLVIFIVGLICHLAGCRRSREDVKNIVEQPLLVENNQLQTNSIKSNNLIQKSEDILF